MNLTHEPVLVASTGVIGQLLDMAKVERGIFSASNVLSANAAPFMEAMLTTDLVEKHATAQVRNGTILGLAKGSGMINPNMATMLAFVVTDLDTSGLDLASIWKRVCHATYNRVTVDGDTSTNDMAIIFANGASGETCSESELEYALNDVCDQLARQIARDGEGATKLIEVRVSGSADPRKIAESIANSPLVKTAMFGCDPNWGRILMAAGKTEVEFDQSSVRLALLISDEEYVLFEDGGPAAFDPKLVSTALKSDLVIIDLMIGPGRTETVYTCDLGYGYVRINAEYHT
jgi:glutamate N-acetyltransferase/amino-acid N-acetyltransferase